MWWVSVALAAPVGVPLGAQRLAVAELPSGWTASVDAAARRCWTKGASEVCLGVEERKGRTAEAILSAARGSFGGECNAVQRAEVGTRVEVQQWCKGYDGAQLQIRGWRVNVDSAGAAIATSRRADDIDQAAHDAFLGSVQLYGPDGFVTRNLQACAAIEPVLAASVDKFAGARTGPGEEVASTLPFPNALGKPKIVTKGGRTYYEARLALMSDAKAAQAKSQALLDELGKCDVWCGQMSSRLAINEPRHSQIVLEVADRTAPLPRCSAATVEVDLTVLDETNGNVTLRVYAP